MGAVLEYACLLTPRKRVLYEFDLNVKKKFNSNLDFLYCIILANVRQLQSAHDFFPCMFGVKSKYTH